MKPRRPTIALLLQRLLLSLLLVTALLAYAVPPSLAVAQMSVGDETEPPCHEMAGAKEMPAPEKAKADPFACCATLACGMMFQALPPAFQPEEPTITGAFARPLGRTLPGLPQPDAAWRPPALFL